MAYKNITAQKILELDFYHDNSTAYNLLESKTEVLNQYTALQYMCYLLYTNNFNMIIKFF